MKLTYSGNEYQTKNVKEMVKLLRINHGLSMRDISKLINKSHTTVWTMLKEFELNKKPQVENVDSNIFNSNLSDEELSVIHNIPLFNIISARKKLGSKKKSKTHISHRRRRLCRYLFGQNYKPGSNFNSFVSNLSDENLTKRQAEVVKSFYVAGSVESQAEDINSDTERVWRSHIRKELKKVIQEVDIENLIKEGVLVNGRIGNIEN